MSEIPLGWRTDLDVLEMSGSHLAFADDHVIVRTPDNPGYHWGNFVLVIDPVLAARPQACLTLFDAAFPGAHHVAIGLPDEPQAADWPGLAVECDTVLAAGDPPRPASIDSGYEVRTLTADDAAQSLSNDLDEQTQADPGYADYARRRIAARQRLVDQGLAVFMGAFREDRLVAELGIVLCTDAARFQNVATVPGHRRRGLASHLLGVAGRWAQDRGAQRFVIVAERDGDAERLYRRAGMRPAGRSWQVYRGGP